MALTLVVLSGTTSDQVPLTLDGPRIVVGRSQAADVVLPDFSLSPRHASFRQRGTDYLVVDEGSTNGTFVGPVRLSPQAPRVVRSGDRIRFGRIWVEVRVEAIPASTTTAKTKMDLATRLVADALTAAGEAVQARVIISAGPDEGAELVLESTERRYVLGRAAECDLVLKETNASRRHLEVFQRGGQAYARDLGSKNGTLLDGVPLPSRPDTPWSPAAILQLGHDRITLVDPVIEALAEFERGADEVLGTDQEVPQPTGAGVFGPGNERPGSGASIPLPRSKKTAETRPSAVTKPDVLVGSIAVALLASSLWGLYWLLGGH